MYFAPALLFVVHSVLQYIIFAKNVNAWVASLPDNIVQNFVIRANPASCCMVGGSRKMLHENYIVRTCIHAEIHTYFVVKLQYSSFLYKTEPAQLYRFLQARHAVKVKYTNNLFPVIYYTLS